MLESVAPIQGNFVSADQPSQGKDLNALLQRGEQELARGHLKEAEAAALNLLRLNNSNPILIGFAGRVYIAQENWERAEKCFRRAAEMATDSSPYLMTLAEILARLRGRADEALAIAEKVLATQPKEPRIFMSAGTIFSKAEHYERAYDLFKQGLDLDPDNSQLNYMTATSARFLGELEAAERYADAAVRLDPENYEGLFLRSDVRKQTPESNHIAEIEARLSHGVKGRESQFHHHYVLAKEYEDIGEYARSFQSLKAGADLRRQGMAYQVEHDVAVMDTLREVFSETFIAQNQNPGCTDKGPIFILGMPRTGTTLLERIIASQGEVTAAGELNELSLMISHIVRSRSKNPKLSKPELVRESSLLDFKKLGETYIGATQDMARGKPYWIDKMPINFLYCGLIHLALPNARMINMVRHPLDTCYANYKMLFNAGAPYSYSLEDLGKYYVAYHKLMQHWQKVLPGKIHVVQYEALTADLETVARGALDHCQLDWNSAVLEFHKNKTASTTASAAQVRQPLYQSSVERWKHYATELQPLREILEAGGVPLN